MISLRVVAQNGLAPAFPIEANFDESGGTIGRADTNRLVLPDPDKTISRMHATIVYRGGDFVLIDNGRALPVILNGQAMGNGREQRIADGDEVCIGPYVMRVRLAHTVASAGSHLVPDPFGSAGVIPPIPEPGGGAGMGVPLIPEDADFLPAPVSNDFLKPDGGGMAVVGSGIQDILPASPGSHRGIDDMIGSASTYGNPFPPNHPLGDLSNPSGAAIPTARDDIPEIHGAYTPPQPRPAAPVDDPRGAVQVSPGAIQQGVRSWDLLHGGGTTGNDIKSVNISSAPPASIPRGGRASQEVSDPAGHRAEAMGGSPAGTKADQEAAKPQCSERGADGATEQLVREFLTGAGVPDLELAVVSPALMRLFGQLLRESLAGALDLLAARAVAKREMRATHTVIVAQDNNPLKHSPNVEVALSLLLSPPARGYMTPVRAVREAFDDLRAHQYAFVEAMRTAMNGLIARFDPAQLEKRIADKSVFDAIPARRKLKLWGQYEELFAAISREAEDDFHSLFGDRFVRAYEENLERLARDRSAGANRS